MADEAYPLPGVTTMSTLAQWEQFFIAMAPDGVVKGVGSDLAGSLNSGARTAVVASGAANIRGFHKPVSSSTSTSIPAAAGQDRIDRLVLRLDRAASLAANFIKPVVLTGTAGSSTPPALTASPTGNWDLPICRWTSASSGALSGLVDERFYAGGYTVSFGSAARAAGLVSAQPPRIGIETDTGKILRSDGSTWTQIYEDSGWVSFSVDGNWVAQASNPLFVRRINNVVHVSGVVNRTENTLPISDTDSPVAAIPAGFRPVRRHFYPAHVYPATGHMQLETSGELKLLSHSMDIPVGRALYLATTYMVG